MRILMFCNFELPDSCADATRVLNFSKMFRNMGHDVDLLGVAKSTTSKLFGSIDGIKYEMLRMGNWTGYRAPKRVIMLGRDIKRFLSETLHSGTYDVILLSGVYYDYFKIFKGYSRKTGAKLVVSALEWYDKSNIQFVGLRGKINFIKNRIALKLFFVQAKNNLAISTLLEKYYGSRGCNTVTIPTIIDMDEYASSTNTNCNREKKLHIAYAGSPGRKDYILNAIYALPLISKEELSKIELHFYGPELKALYNLGLTEEFLNTYRDNIICHGRIPYADVKARIADADFTVLLRPNKRYANAGFPTKVGESMACGTPVIANITSDLGKYIIDGETGIVCTNETPEACAEGFRRALAMTTEEKTKMRRAAYDMANTGFNYLSYVDDMREFLERAL